MLDSQTCPNTRYMVEKEQRCKDDSNASVSSDDESAPSETTLDDICEVCSAHALRASLEGPFQDLLDFHSREGSLRFPIGFDRVRDIQHNSSSIGFGNTMGKFQGVIGSVMSRNVVPLNTEVFTKAPHIMSFRGDRFHIGTLHCAEAR